MAVRPRTAAGILEQVVEHRLDDGLQPSHLEHAPELGLRLDVAHRAHAGVVALASPGADFAVALLVAAAFERGGLGDA